MLVSDSVSLTMIKKDLFLDEFRRFYDNTCAEIDSLADQWTSTMAVTEAAKGVAAVTIATTAPTGCFTSPATKAAVDGLIGILAASFIMWRIEDKYEKIEHARGLKRVFNSRYKSNLRDQLANLLYQRFQFAIERLIKEGGITTLASFFMKIIVSQVIDSKIKAEANKSSEKPYLQTLGEGVVE